MKVIFSFSFLLFFVVNCETSRAEELKVYFPPDYLKKGIPSEAITTALSVGLGQKVTVTFLPSYKELADAVEKPESFIVYAGSFTQAVFYARGRVLPFLQGIDGKEIYHGSLLARKDIIGSASQIVEAAGSKVAFAYGSSGGELTAKFVTRGAASIGFEGQKDAARSVQQGTAACAFVKNVWWEHAGHLFPDLQLLEYPGLAEIKHNGNLLGASKEVPLEKLAIVRKTLINNPALFHVENFIEVQPSVLESTLTLMPQAGIDPRLYKW